LHPAPQFAHNPATLSRLISAALPSDHTCSDGAKDVIHDCCKEFVQLLASEANEMTANGAESGRGRISAAHLVAALSQLGYDRYVPDANEIAEGEKADAKVRDERTRDNVCRGGSGEGAGIGWGGMHTTPPRG